jgi:hypothetical protein
MVGPAAHGQVNGFNDSEKGGDQKAALQVRHQNAIKQKMSRPSATPRGPQSSQRRHAAAIRSVTRRSDRGGLLVAPDKCQTQFRPNRQNSKRL